MTAPRPTVSVRVLGAPGIAVDDLDDAAPELRARQARVLLTLLVLAGDDGVPRDALAGAIWITDRPRAWETALSALVSRLRSMFARIGIEGDVLTFDAGVYRFVPPSEVVVDIDDAVAATEHAREAFARGDANDAQARAEAAVKRFRGPVLPDEDSELVVRARRRVTDVHTAALAILADAARAQHRPEPAVEAANETTNEDRDPPPGHQRSRPITASLAVLLVVAIAAGGFALRERDRARQKARDAQVHSLALDSGARRATAADVALLLARQANEWRDTPQTRAALLSALEEPPGLSRFLRTDAPVTAIAAGPTANTVITGHANGNIVIWDPERREPLTGNASGNGSAVRAIAVNAETMRAATGTDDGLVREWDLGTGSPLGDAITYLSPHDGAPVGIANLAYAADGLVVVGRDDTMRRYSATGESIAAEVMQERPSASGDLGILQAVDRDGTLLARPGDSGVVLWDLQRPASAGIRGSFAMAPGSATTALAIAPEARVAATSAGNLLDLWDVTTGARLGESTELDQAVSSLAFSPDGTMLAVGLVGGDARLVDVAQHAVLPATLGGAAQSVTALAFDVSGGSLFVGRAGGATTVYALRDRSVVHALPRYDGEGRSVAFGTRGVILGAGSGPATIWSTDPPGTASTVLAEHADLVAARPHAGEFAVAIGGRVVLADEVSSTERELVALPAEAGTVSALAFDETGQLLAIATSEGGVAVFDVDHGFSALPVRLGVEISSLALTASGELWLSDRDGVRSYRASDGRALRVLADSRARGVAAIAADPSEPRLAVATAEGVLFVDLDDLRVSGPVLGDHGPARAVAYSPDGSMVAAALDDGTVALWDGRSLQSLGAPLPITRTHALAFSPDGGALAALGVDGNAAVVTTDPEAWRRSACEIASRQLTRTEWETFLPGTHYDPAC